MEVPQRIEVQDGSRLIVEWDDGSTIEVSATDLRAACQCAGCREPDGIEQTRRTLEGPAEITITDAALVGGYAVSFVFAPDGHGTGIYPFDQLADLGTS